MKPKLKLIEHKTKTRSSRTNVYITFWPTVAAWPGPGRPCPSSPRPRPQWGPGDSSSHPYHSTGSTHCQVRWSIIILLFIFLRSRKKLFWLMFQGSRAVFFILLWIFYFFLVFNYVFCHCWELFLNEYPIPVTLPAWHFQLDKIVH